MTSRASIALAALGLVYAFSCGYGGPLPKKKKETPAGTAPARAKPVPPRPPSTVFPPEVPEVPRPAPSSAPRIERERAVLVMLRGENTLGVPSVATDDGKPVDPKLRDALAPS